MLRSLDKVQAEVPHSPFYLAVPCPLSAPPHCISQVDNCMNLYDTDASGALEFTEFVAMVCSGGFKIPLAAELKWEVFELCS